MPGKPGRVVLQARNLELPPGINHQYVNAPRRPLTPRARLWAHRAFDALSDSMIAQGLENQAVIKTNQRTGLPYLAPDRKKITWLEVFYEMWTFNQDGDAPSKLVQDVVQEALGLEDWWAQPPLAVKHIVHRKAACHMDIVVIIEPLPHEQAWNQRAQRRAAALYRLLEIER